MNKILFIVGPTASGKTSLAIKLAKRFNGEIINADSRSIYKELPILTAMPTMRERKNIPHHLFGSVALNKTLTLKEYQRQATKKVTEIHRRGFLPIVVGGSALYINSLAYDYKIPELSPNKELRTKLENQSLEKLVIMLVNLDKTAVTKIDLKNKRRVIRAIELATIFGSVPERKKSPLASNKFIIGIQTSDPVWQNSLVERINRMYRIGAVSEVRRHLRILNKRPPVSTSCGADPILQHLRGEISIEESKNLFLKNDKRLAKKQMTWFKANKDIVWVKTPTQSISVVSDFLKK